MDSSDGEYVRVHSISGHQVGAITSKGRNELRLPQGLYVVLSGGKTVKVRL
ncbi:MAG: hypothetical protein HDR88_01975 [Bacteroides sp.]|nr:hypothetical protein [Bacteroides sp.]